MFKITGKDLILLLLYAPGRTGEYNEKIEGRTRLQKMVFLFEKEVYPNFKKDALISEEDLPKFESYHYGPFSKQVFDDIEFLIGLGFVEVISSDEQIDMGEQEEYKQWLEETGIEENWGSDNDIVIFEKQAFILSDIGKKFVEEKLWPALSDNQKNAIAGLKLNCTEANLNSILHYVYKKYPDFTTKSRIRDEILGNVLQY
ncbi:hypothetical protein DXT63_15615 [Thermoanaerobacteraceae bacterium SP2]|jgi:uncharacterized protein YwgA|nr:hypothetical protein DXT63_15615 [Thermoanaerobacteraceae bacterium SP2]